MAAALIRRRTDEGSLRRTNVVRDLSQIAELIDICFSTSMDANGEATVREMKFLGSLGPLLWLLELLGGTGMGRGYVWRADGRVVGNVSVHPGGNHPFYGRGWLIANVAVHPTYRRKGIARALMDAAMDMVQELGGRWVALQVEADNPGAYSLYDGLGFDTFETLSHWTADVPTIDLLNPSNSIWQVRERRLADSIAEMQLIYERARLGAMAWTQPLSRQEVRDDWLGDLGHIIAAEVRSRYVLPDPTRPDRLLGSLWIEASGWRQSRLTLFLDPSLTDPIGRQALLRYALDLPGMAGRTLNVEALAGDQPIEDYLRAAGFRKVRTLVQMRYQFG